MLRTLYLRTALIKRTSGRILNRYVLLIFSGLRVLRTAWYSLIQICPGGTWFWSRSQLTAVLLEDCHGVTHCLEADVIIVGLLWSRPRPPPSAIFVLIVFEWLSFLPFRILGSRVCPDSDNPAWFPWVPVPLPSRLTQFTIHNHITYVSWKVQGHWFLRRYPVLIGSNALLNMPVVCLLHYAWLSYDVWTWCKLYFSPMALAAPPPSGLWPHSWGFENIQNDAPQSVGLLWTSDQPVAETSTWQHTALTTDRHPCPRWDSNPQSQQASGRRPTL